MKERENAKRKVKREEKSHSELVSNNSRWEDNILSCEKGGEIIHQPSMRLTSEVSLKFYIKTIGS